jgi:hypothetical protein
MTSDEPTWDADTVVISETATMDTADGHTQRRPHDRQSEPQTLRFTRLALLALLLAAGTSVFYLGRTSIEPQSRRAGHPSAHTADRPSEPDVSHRHRLDPHTDDVDSPARDNTERPRRHRHTAPEASAPSPSNHHGGRPRNASSRTPLCYLRRTATRGAHATRSRVRSVTTTPNTE